MVFLTDSLQCLPNIIQGRGSGIFAIQGKLYILHINFKENICPWQTGRTVGPPGNLISIEKHTVQCHVGAIYEDLGHGVLSDFELGLLDTTEVS